MVKDTIFYMSNHLFHIKLTLFIVLGVLSIFPTIKILKWKKSVRNNSEPEITAQSVSRLLMFVRIELLILAIMPLLAVMIARGT
jgi:putative membrane protein